MTALVVVENDEVISSKILFYIMKLPDVFFFFGFLTFYLWSFRMNMNVFCQIHDSLKFLVISWVWVHPFSTYMRKIFRKTNISYPLIRTRTCAYQGLRNVSCSENFAHVLNGWTQEVLTTTMVYRNFFK